MNPASNLGVRAFLGRRCVCGAGGHSMGDTGLECTVRAAATGGGGGRLCRPGAAAGEGRA